MVPTAKHQRSRATLCRADTPTLGFTLIEVLISFTIIALIAAIVIPVLSSSHKSGYSAASTLHLRQIGMAVMMYKEIYGGWPNEHLDDVLAAELITDDRLLYSRNDDFDEGYGHLMSRCIRDDPPTALQSSYETAFRADGNGNMGQLLQIDSNPGIVVDRTIGQEQVYPKATGYTCVSGASYYYSGRMLRLRMDGSVEHANFSLEPPPWIKDSAPFWSYYFLFTEKYEGPDQLLRLR